MGSSKRSTAVCARRLAAAQILAALLLSLLAAAQDNSGTPSPAQDWNQQQQQNNQQNAASPSPAQDWNQQNNQQNTASPSPAQDWNQNNNNGQQTTASPSPSPANDGNQQNNGDQQQWTASPSPPQDGSQSNGQQWTASPSPTQDWNQQSNNSNGQQWNGSPSPTQDWNQQQNQQNQWTASPSPDAYNNSPSPNAWDASPSPSPSPPPSPDSSSPSPPPPESTNTPPPPEPDANATATNTTAGAESQGEAQQVATSKDVAATSSGSSSSTSKKSSGGSNTGAIAGAVIGVLAAVALVAVVVYLFVFRKKKSARRNSSSTAAFLKSVVVAPSSGTTGPNGGAIAAVGTEKHFALAPIAADDKVATAPGSRSLTASVIGTEVAPGVAAGLAGADIMKTKSDKKGWLSNVAAIVPGLPGSNPALNTGAQYTRVEVSAALMQLRGSATLLLTALEKEAPDASRAVMGELKVVSKEVMDGKMFQRQVMQHRIWSWLQTHLWIPQSPCWQDPLLPAVPAVLSGNKAVHDAQTQYRDYHSRMQGTNQDPEVNAMVEEISRWLAADMGLQAQGAPWLKEMCRVVRQAITCRLITGAVHPALSLRVSNCSPPIAGSVPRLDASLRPFRPALHSISKEHPSVVDEATSGLAPGTSGVLMCYLPGVGFDAEPTALKKMGLGADQLISWEVLEEVVAVVQPSSTGEAKPARNLEWMGGLWETGRGRQGS